MARLDTFLSLLARHGASDLHVSTGLPPSLRVDGQLRALPFRPLTDADSRALLAEILSPAQQKALATGREVDFLRELPGVGRFRGQAFAQSRGASAVLRFIPPRVPALAELGVPAAVEKLVTLQSGLLLVTGPASSGKSTTLAALVNAINHSSARHVLTIEDPVEFVHQPVKSVVTQRQVGRDAESFSSALRSALREAPDVIVVGDLKDEATVSLALGAAETGALVIGALHTDGAAAAVERIGNLVEPGAQEQARAVLSVLLRGVLSQRLYPRAGGRGRVAAFELLVNNHAVANCIREKKVHQLDSYLDNPAQGGQSFATALRALERQGAIAQSARTTPGAAPVA